MLIWSAEIKEIERLYFLLGDMYPELKKELENLIKADDKNVALLYSRRCLEVIITNLCECELNRSRGTDPLKGIIDRLNKEEKVPSNIITSMHGLNELSTFGTHPKDFDPEQVKPVLNNLFIVVKWFLKYKDPERFDKVLKTEEKDQAKPELKREKIIDKSDRKRWLLVSGILSVIIIGIFIIKYLGPGKQGIKGFDSKAIAVMPVLNFTGYSDLGWIAEMIHNDLIGKLQGISNLIVRPRQTTLQFRDSKESLQSIAQKLNVNNLIEASIKGSENNLNIEIRIVEAFPEEKYLYTSTFNKNFEELTSIYGEVINNILKNIQVKATDREEKILSVERKVNPELRRACARGLYHLNLLTEEDVKKGIDYYKEAISIDPGDPEPYIGLAIALGIAGHGAGIITDALQLSEAYALKAIELDPEETHPNIGDAHIILAQKYFCRDYNFDKAIFHLNRGLQLNPNSPLAHYLNGWYLALLVKIDEAVEEMKKAIAIDPLNPQWPGNLAWMYLWIGRYEESLVYVEKTLNVSPNFPMAFYVKGMVYSAIGRHDEAIELQKSVYKSGAGGYSSGLGVAYAFAGKTDLAQATALEIEKYNRRWITYGLAELYATLGNTDKAIFWLEEAFRQQHDFIPWISSNPNFNNLHNDQRYIDILDRLNLPK